MTETTGRVRAGWTVAVFAFVALEGAVLQMRGAVVPALRETFGAPASLVGLVAPAGTVGFVVTVALAGALAGRLGTRRLLFVGAAGAGAGVLAMGLAPSFSTFLLALLLRGAFGGAGRGSDRPLLSHLYPEARGRLFGYYDTTWAVGAAVGPLAVAAALRVGDWRLAYWAVAALFVPVAALVAVLPAPDAAGDDPLDLAAARRVVRDPGVATMALGLFLAVGVEGGLFTWLTTFAGDRLPGSLRAASLSVLLVAYVPGRLLAGRLVARVGPLRLSAALAAGTLAALAYTLVAEGLAVLAGLFVVGATLSGQFPTLLTHATERVPEHSAPVNALSQVVGAAAIALVPFAMGFVVEGRGVGAAMGLLLVPLAALVVVAGGRSVARGQQAQ
jgi:fucose permease